MLEMVFHIKPLLYPRQFTLDDLLTNVMIYWTTGTIVSSMRFYKENMKNNIESRLDYK